MTQFFIGPNAIDLLIAQIWDEAYARDPATLDLLAEPAATPNESRRRSRSTLLSPRKSGTIGDNKEGARAMLAKKPVIGPIVFERHDEEDGYISYEVWDHNPDTYHRLCRITERESGSAKHDAQLIVTALNFYLKGHKS